MTWIENAMIVFGISFEIFVIMECKGSMVAKIKKGQLAFIAMIFSAMQLVMLWAGYFLSTRLISNVDSKDGLRIGHILAITIFILLGVRLIAKAIKNEMIHERLEVKTEWKKYILSIVVIEGYTVATGIAAGLCGSNFVNLVILVIVVTFVASLAGMYTGYRAGFEQKTKAYIAGGVLLIIAGIDMAIRCFIL